MLSVEVKLIEEIFTPNHKEEIVSKITDAMVSIEGKKLRPVSCVTIEEICNGEWSIGGQAMDAGVVDSPAASKK